MKNLINEKKKEEAAEKENNELVFIKVLRKK